MFLFRAGGKVFNIRWLNAMLHPEAGKKPKWNREQQFRQDGDIARPS